MSFFALSGSAALNPLRIHPRTVAEEQLSANSHGCCPQAKPDLSSTLFQSMVSAFKGCLEASKPKSGEPAPDTAEGDFQPPECEDLEAIGNRATAESDVHTVDISKLLRDLTAADEGVVLTAARTLRKLFGGSLGIKVAEAGGIEALARLLSSPSSSASKVAIVYECCRAFGAARQHWSINVAPNLIVVGAVPALIGLLGHPHWQIRDEVTVLTGFCARNSPQFRELATSLGAMGLIASHIDPNAVLPARKSLAALQRLLYGYESVITPQTSHVFKAEVLPTLARLLYSAEDPELFDSVFLTFMAYLGVSGADRTARRSTLTKQEQRAALQACLELGICKRLCELISSKGIWTCDNACIYYLLNLIGTMFDCSDELQMTVLVNAEVLAALASVFDCTFYETFLDCSGKRLKELNARWKAMSLLAKVVNCATQDQLDECIKAGIMGRMAQSFSKVDFETGVKVCFALYEGCSCVTEEQAGRMVAQAGVVEGLIDLTENENEDIADAAWESVQSLYSVNLSIVEDLLATTGACLDELFPYYPDYPSCRIKPFHVDLVTSRDAPIQPHRRLIREFVKYMLNRSDGVPSCATEEECRECIRKRLGPLRDDAWKRRHQLAFAHGAFRRGYRLWEKDSTTEEEKDGGGAGIVAGDGKETLHKVSRLY
jgi:hypothetical protein